MAFAHDISMYVYEKYIHIYNSVLLRSLCFISYPLSLNPKEMMAGEGLSGFLTQPLLTLGSRGFSKIAFWEM